MELINFSGSTFLITGGTGSFGTKMLYRLLKLNAKEIRIFSRDEKKQLDLKKEINNHRVKFFIGDIRDKQSMFDAFLGVDYVFHAAALKQVDTLEKFPLEAVKTNLMGTENVIELAIEHKIKKVVFLSTDKAVNPINAMGMSKSLMEKLILSKNKASTQLIITRFGNVIASRGSVIPYFIDAVKTGKELTLTNEEMTRFLMSMEQALDLVMFAFEKGNHHDLFVYKCFATKIVDLINAIETILNCKAKIKITGIRPGEKIHEELISSSDYQKAEVVDQSYFLISPNNHKSTNSSSITKNYSSRDNVISIQELIRILFDNEEVKVLIQQDK